MTDCECDGWTSYDPFFIAVSVEIGYFMAVPHGFIGPRRMMKPSLPLQRGDSCVHSKFVFTTYKNYKNYKNDMSAAIY